MKIKTVQLFKLPEGVRIPGFGGKLYAFLSKIENRIAGRIPIENLSLNSEKREKKIIVSLTSFPARINTVGFAIKTLMNQTVKADRMILWLAADQFDGVELPEMLRQLEKKGLEIKYCEDLKSHKKYHYVLKDQKPDELIITYDDDLIYPEDSIERLYKTHLQYPDCIVCSRAVCPGKDGSGFSPYRFWKTYTDAGVTAPDSRLFPSTGGGTLYPCGAVNEEAFDVEKMRALAWSADDLWMRFMSALNKTMIVKTRKNHKTFSTLEGSQAESLQVLNCLGGENDRTLERLSRAYPDAVEFILGDRK